ncbi:MAG: Crp/Fnr family transcriptional regulator [Acidobacteriota bacterium]|jgi:CRP/FNR family transcriptional regulator
MKIDLIRRVSLFATLSDEEFNSLEPIFQVKTYRRNQIIFLEEETGHYMYIVLAGKVKVIKTTSAGKETILAIHQVGDFFGEMALLDGKTAPATVSAMEDCRIAAIHHSDFQRMLMSNEKVVRQIVQVLCSRLRQVWAQVQDLSYSTADDRIRAGILQLSRKHGVQDARGIIIDLKITHQELAELVGTSRETVTRTLARLQKKGILELENRRIILLKPKELMAGT